MTTRTTAQHPPLPARVTAQHSPLARTTAQHSPLPARVTVAGMAADLYGARDGRPPLVLLHGLTFDRRIWQPILDQLWRIDPDRQVLVLDLPGHGESGNQLPHSTQHLVNLIGQAVDDAELDVPVLVGHSISGGLASVYPSYRPARGVVNVDAIPDLAPFVALLHSVADQVQGDGFPAVWAMMEQTFRADLLPPAARELVARNSRPEQDLVLGYWRELLAQTPKQASDWLDAQMAALAANRVPYLLIAGSQLPADAAARMERLLPRASIEVWPDTGHFPHLAHLVRFAERLAETTRWA